MRLGLGLGLSRSGGIAPGKVYIADGHVDFGASVKTISGAASYPSNDFEMTGSGTIGTTIFTRSGGDPLTDLGTNCVFVALEDASGNIEMNVTAGYSGSDVTLLRPLGITPTKLCQAHKSFNEQHISAKGAAGLAQWILAKTKQECYLQKASYSLWCGDVFGSTPWKGLSASNIWRPYGGLPNNQFSYDSALNFFAGTKSVVWKQSRVTILCSTDAAGEGVHAIFSTENKKAMLSFTVGGNALTSEINVTVLEDEVETFNEDYVGGLVTRIYHEVPTTTSEIEVRITRTTTGTSDIKLGVGDIYLACLEDIAGEETDPVIGANDKVLLLGDSWFDEENINGTPFDTEFRAKHAGTVANEAIGGSIITDWKGNVAGWVAEHKPDIAIIHTGINDYNTSSRSGATFWGDMKDVVNTLTGLGVNVMIVKQGCTASTTQSQGLAELMNEFSVNLRDTAPGAPYADRWPKLQGEFINDAAANEFTNSAALINNRNKVPGTRLVTRLSDSAILTPTGTAAADAWEEA